MDVPIHQNYGSGFVVGDLSGQGNTTVKKYRKSEEQVRRGADAASYSTDPLTRPPATLSPHAGRGISREFLRPAKRGKGAAKRRMRGFD